MQSRGCSAIPFVLYNELLYWCAVMSAHGDLGPQNIDLVSGKVVRGALERGLSASRL